MGDKEMSKNLLKKGLDNRKRGKRNMEKKIAGSCLVAFSLVVGFGGCAKSSTTPPKTVTGQASITTAALQTAFSVSVFASDSAKNPISPALYSDANKSSSFQLTAGKAYIFKLASNVSSLKFNMTYVNVDLPGATVSASVSLSVGNNYVVAPAAADYSFVITPVTSSSVQALAKTYQASVSCANPSFSTKDLTPANIKVTAAGTSASTTNLYTFDASNVVNAVNQGQPPFLCAWDYNGTGIVDSGFTACGTPSTNIYVTYVGKRNVGLIVKDACNSPVSVTQLSNLTYPNMTFPGNTYIQVATSGTGVVGGSIANSNDPRIYGVSYLSTNPGWNPVLPSFNPNSSDHSISNFNIISNWTYGMPSSLNFGVGITVGGILGDYTNNGSGNGTLDVSHATASISYTTDQNGDSAPAVPSLGGTCTLSNQRIISNYSSGPPCAAGTTGDQSTLSIEVMGNISCQQITVPGGNAITITGSFDGMKTISNACAGGGGGGGISPVGF
jgi:hypothetical protein